MSAEARKPEICPIDILSQWQNMIESKEKENQARRDNWMAPPIGIEEALKMNIDDVNTLMWFLDKTLKLMAYNKANQNSENK